MQGVKPVDIEPEATALPFPFNLRFSMAAWNLLFAEQNLSTRYVHAVVTAGYVSSHGYCTDSGTVVAEKKTGKVLNNEQPAS